MYTVVLILTQANTVFDRSPTANRIGQVLALVHLYLCLKEKD